jgi:hypothetical protein
VGREQSCDACQLLFNQRGKVSGRIHTHWYRATGNEVTQVLIELGDQEALKNGDTRAHVQPKQFLTHLDRLVSRGVSILLYREEERALVDLDDPQVIYPKRDTACEAVS